VQGPRERGQAGIDVGVAFVGLAAVELLFDTGQAGGDGRGEGEIGIGVRFSMRKELPWPTTRNPVVRLSVDQASLVGAQLAAWKRL
jgi:hypothetical protein